jgi:hypothetical protein
MRIVLAATVAFAFAFNIATPVLAAQKNPGPDWQRCYYLGWVRGVHVELGELPQWMDECMSGGIPFDISEASAQSHQAQSAH